MIPAQQLLNEHLDNIAIKLRNPKPFTPNDFPAVQRIEQAIRDKPLEQGWFFDSTGMPVGMNQGEPKQVSGMYIDEELIDLPIEQANFYQKFWDKPALLTHNHPSSSQTIEGLKASRGYSPLSRGDLEYSSIYGMPIRAVNSSYGSGMVHEFKPGVASYYDVKSVLETDPTIHRNQPLMQEKLRAKEYFRKGEYDDNIPVQLTPENSPTLNSYMMPHPSQIDNSIMATDSFNIRRQEKPRQAVFQQQGDGTYQSLIDGKPYKTLTEDETDAAIDKMRNDPKWQMTVRAYRGDSAF